MGDLSSILILELVYRSRELITWVLIIMAVWLISGMLSTAFFRSSDHDDDDP